MVIETVKLPGTLGRGNGRASWKRSTVRQAHTEMVEVEKHSRKGAERD